MRQDIARVVIGQRIVSVERTPDENEAYGPFEVTLENGFVLRVNGGAADAVFVTVLDPNGHEFPTSYGEDVLE